jgi:antitoxin component of RelBE/YafQ-DinJ toxin-antitoxin module
VPLRREYGAAKDGGTVTIGVRVPAEVAAKIDAMAERAGLGRGDVVRLALAKVPDDLIPESLAANAELMRAIRGV